MFQQTLVLENVSAKISTLEKVLENISSIRKSFSEVRSSTLLFIKWCVQTSLFYFFPSFEIINWLRPRQNAIIHLTLPGQHIVHTLSQRSYPLEKKRKLLSTTRCEQNRWNIHKCNRGNTLNVWVCFKGRNHIWEVCWTERWESLIVVKLRVAQ